MRNYTNHSVILGQDGKYHCQKDTPAKCGWVCERRDFSALMRHVVENQYDLTTKKA
jgi:hypothetical protein